MLRINRIGIACCLLWLASLASDAMAQSTVNVDRVLDKTSKEVSAFLEQFSDVKCTEHVQRTKFDKGGHAEASDDSTYDYFVLLQGSGDDLLLNESRLQEKAPKARSRNIPMLITNGFSTLFLIFHPYYRNSFQFSGAQEETLDGVRLWRVDFVHVPGMRTPAAVAVRGREFPLELGGTAWIDPQTGTIARLDTRLNNDMKDVGLRSLNARIDFAPVQLPGWARTYRLPVTATIDVETLRQRWRNVHRFTNYQRFMVDTEVSVSDNIEKK